MKYLLSVFFVFMFTFAPGISQAQDRQEFLSVDGVCGGQREGSLHRATLCLSGSFILIKQTDRKYIYACSGSFGGKSILCVMGTR